MLLEIEKPNPRKSYHAVQDVVRRTDTLYVPSHESCRTASCVYYVIRPISARESQFGSRLDCICWTKIVLNPEVDLPNGGTGPT